MKKFKIFAIVAAAMAFTACSDDFLDVQKPDGEPLEEYYSTEARVQESLISAYAPLHFTDWDGKGYDALTICHELMSDDFWVGGQNSTDNNHWQHVGNFNALPTQTLSTFWRNFYKGVKRCNDAIKYVGWNRGKLDDTTLNEIEMQARVLRVYYYKEMWKFYGNIPFYLENLSFPYTAPQLSADEIYDKLIVELEEIINANVLPMRWDAKNAGRVSQAMAYMLYAEMTMYQNDDARLPKTLDYMKTVIGDSNYGLNPDYAALWLESGEWCNESIWEINYNTSNCQRDWATPSNPDLVSYAGGTVLPTLIAPEGWVKNDDGTELDGWEGGDGWGFLPVRTSSYNLFEAGDVRRDATIWDVRSLIGTDLDYKKYRFQDTHLWLAKYRPRTENNANCPTSKNLNYNNNVRIYRYSEALLNAAELIVRGYGSGDAQGYLDQVRARAGVASVTATLDNIIKERRFEFMGEGKRYWDLVRLVDVPESSVNALTELVEADFDGTNTGDRGRIGHWTKSKKYLPIDQSELDADDTLVQNKYGE